MLYSLEVLWFYFTYVFIRLLASAADTCNCVQGGGGVCRSAQPYNQSPLASSRGRHC